MRNCEKHTSEPIVKTFMDAPSSKTLLLSPSTALLFLITCLLTYLAGGMALQSHAGIFGIFLSQLFFLFLPCVIFSLSRGLPLDEWSDWNSPTFYEITLVIFITLSLSIASDLLISLQSKIWPIPESIQNFYQSLIKIDSFPEAIFKILILAVTPAFAEEIFFRGVLQTSWTQRFGKGWGIVWTSLAFAFAHGNPWYFHFYFILGFFLGRLKELRGSLWLPITAHFVNNAWTLFDAWR